MSLLNAQEMDHSTMDQSHRAHAQANAERAGSAQPRTQIPALTEADRLAARPPSMYHIEDDSLHAYTLVDRAETWRDNDATGLGWDAQGWIGGDINRGVNLWQASNQEDSGSKM